MRNFRDNRFWRNPEVQLHHDALNTVEAIVVSRGDRHFRIEGLPMKVLIALDESPRDLVTLSLQVLSVTTDEAVSDIYNAICRLQLRGLVYSDWPARLDGTSDVRNPPKRSRPIDFVWRFPILGQNWVRILAQPLLPLFSPRAMLLLIPLMMMLQGLFLFQHRALILYSRSYLWHLDQVSLAGVLLGNYVALLCHELGHAAGCLRSGVANGSIGICMYLIFPGLYTEVTNSWKVSGKKRLLVDTGGIYISLILASAFTLTYMLLPWPPFLLLVLLCDVTVLVNLNPLLRMDGYWIVSDVLEIPHLMDINKAITSALLLKAVCGRAIKLPTIPISSRWARASYFAYYFCFLGGVLYAIVLTLLHGVPFILSHYPLLVQRTAQSLENGHWSGTTVQVLITFLITTVSIGSLALVGARLSLFIRDQIVMLNRIRTKKCSN